MAETWRPIPGVQVIGITGRARSGKDELAKALVRAVPGAERFAFSDAVAVMARVVHRMNGRDARVLQTVGTQYREQDEAVWLRCLYGILQDRRPRLAVVTGVRYANELGLIYGLGGIVVGVRRPWAPALTDRDPHHVVEQGIDDLVDRATFTVTQQEHDTPAALEHELDAIAGLIAERFGCTHR